MEAVRAARHVELASGVVNHAHRNLSGEGAFTFPVSVLRSDGDGAAERRGCRGCKCGEWRCDDDVAFGSRRHQRLERLEERTSFLQRLVHLPISGDYWTAQRILLYTSLSPGAKVDFMVCR